MKALLLLLLYICITIGCAIGLYYVYRWFNWTFGYSGYVEEMFREHLEKYHGAK